MLVQKQKNPFNLTDDFTIRINNTFNRRFCRTLSGTDDSFSSFLSSRRESIYHL